MSDIDDQLRAYAIDENRFESLLKKHRFASPRALATKLGIKPDRIYDALSGETNKLAVDILLPVSDLLEVDPEYLLGYQDIERRCNRNARSIRMIPVVGDIWPGHYLETQGQNSYEHPPIPAIVKDDRGPEQFAYRVHTDKFPDKASFVICLPPDNDMVTPGTKLVIARRVQTLTERSIYEKLENGIFVSIFDHDIEIVAGNYALDIEAIVSATFSQVGAQLPL